MDIEDKKTKEQDQTSYQQISHGRKYTDDITMFMSYQNWCWLNYSHMLYQKLIYQQAIHSSQMLSLLHRPPQAQSPAATGQTRQNQQRTTVKLASIYKRMLAEIIDFLLLAFIKVFAVYYIYGDSYIDHFNFILVIDEQTSLDDLQWMMMQAVLFRFIVVAYEAYLLSGTMPNSRGYTIGKKMMGLSVVYATEIEVANGVEETVHLHFQPLGIGRSCVRSLLKNMAMSVLFPVMLPVLMFNHNRLIYDLVVGSIVIEKEE